MGNKFIKTMIRDRKAAVITNRRRWFAFGGWGEKSVCEAVDFHLSFSRSILFQSCGHDPLSLGQTVQPVRDQLSSFSGKL
ncbi:MAG: hypothetical protein WCC87_15585 [Candidatus Korobacteraceae bacterium]